MRWAEEHTLIWAAHQLEQWSQRLAKSVARSHLSPTKYWRRAEKRALAVVQKIEDELEAELQGQVESYLEMTNSNRQFLHRDGALTTAECCSRSTDQLAPTMERIGSSETT